MSMNDQRGPTAPGMVGGYVPGTTITLPSELAHVEPTRVDEATQQASTQPGDGQLTRYVVVDPPSWREKFIGYAKIHRGTILRRPALKEHGEKILQGQATIDDPNKVPERRGHFMLEMVNDARGLN